MEIDYQESEQLAETQREILEECNEYAENCWRAENDGWFYSDDDGNDDQWARQSAWVDE